MTRTVIETLTREVELEPQERAALLALYGAIWTEARYDPDTEATRRFAEKLLPHIQLLNQRWRFKK